MARAIWRSLPGSVRRRVPRRGRPRPPLSWEIGFNFDPPSVPPGFVVASPDFIGLGAAKAGTTWWHSLIAKHPGVYSGPNGYGKELHYLRIEPLCRDLDDADVMRYAGWFARPPGMLAGEWTPWYLFHHWMGSMLALLAPDAKLLVILRDPVERYESAITMSKRTESYRASTAQFHVRQGFSSQFLRYLEPHIDRDRLLVLQYERCVREPAVQLARTFAFLGLADHEVEGVETPVNAARTPRIVLPSERRSALTELYRADVADLVARYPEIDLGLWPNFTT